jgi:hypothetical protein
MAKGHKDFLIALSALDRRIEDAGSLKPQIRSECDHLLGRASTLSLLTHNSAPAHLAFSDLELRFDERDEPRAVAQERRHTRQHQREGNE